MEKQAKLFTQKGWFALRKRLTQGGTQWFGLVAEDVEQVDRDLVVRDEQGRTYSVRYVR